ncbi:MAG: cysteinyl-tRNA synthetase [Alphaproteobacteria bacterium]|jgi:cysteinyl-tRNA synthetase|nr:cysteinyl-tRNA synthetase [Alphaproteobacteria bacterium]
MGLVLYNTLTKKKEVFTPLNPDQVGMYVCGPTVYDFAHVGNARPFVVFDVLARLLRHAYPKVCYVRNITDVDDKINAASSARKETIADLTQRTTAAFHQDMESLSILPPDVEPRATHHIPEMIGIIQALIDKGHAYEAEGHVLFSVASFSDYGKLSRRNQEEMLAGARVEVAPYKRDPGDFVLWKPSDHETPGWESPWGFGRPGWHIECSAMSSRYLGTMFDIHGGGQDLIFPHHENELAQSRCAHGTPVFARYWMHNGYLTIQGDKMSKSLGNFFTVRDMLAHYPGEVIRFALLSTHYRQPMDWTESALNQARHGVDRLYTALKGRRRIDENAQIDPGVREALDDDLNTPLAIARFHDLATALNKATDEAEQSRLSSVLKASGRLMGLLQQDPESWFHGNVATGITPLEIEGQIQARRQARDRKDFAESDRIRDALHQQGIVLEDGPEGTTWRSI